MSMTLVFQTVEGEAPSLPGVDLNKNKLFKISPCGKEQQECFITLTENAALNTPSTWQNPARSDSLFTAPPNAGRMTSFN